ncbi:helix-turn-helix domain-containing protein [Burkholderia sp. SCN-KJ]|uniref:helix-turn-helix domain-containing protein n=1 Tax=Burkholderia sp. SCN-KJ TaxID=2969248 RepID=UPI00214FE4B5|nr:helix-turn-helix transcriptional regulator [Burkholderia sp. SCN-KJ]MCR4470400.1 helix-turn-helix domain-containing protein [Burkholderia sp. SCN-KJ]
MSLGAKLNTLRLRKAESLQATADAVGVTKTHIWELEKGKSANPTAELLARLAAHFEVTVDFLLDTGRDTPSEDDEATVFFRDLQLLSERDRATVKQMIRHFKESLDHK